MLSTSNFIFCLLVLPVDTVEFKIPVMLFCFFFTSVCVSNCFYQYTLYSNIGHEVLTIPFEYENNIRLAFIIYHCILEIFCVIYFNF